MEENRSCQNCKIQFTIEREDFDFYEKIAVPPPTFCPECRSIQRFATRNVKYLYKRTCDGCDKNVVSRVSKSNPAKMFCKDCFWSDDWDPCDYGRDYDFTRTFFEQFHELLLAVPHGASLNSNMVASDYCNMESDDKNCYLTFGGHYNEDSMFSEYSIHGKQTFDSYWAFYDEKVYETIITEKCFRTFYSQQCYECLDTYFSYDCHNSSNIFGCAGLRNKQYCIFNVQYTKEDYVTFLENANLGSHESVQSFLKKSRELWIIAPHKANIILQSNDVSGNYIMNTKNSHDVWQADGVENMKHACIVAWGKDCQDETSCGYDELCYMTASGGGMYRCFAIVFSFKAGFEKGKHTLDSQYGYTVISSKDTFGCVSLRSKQHCILNKQYSKEEYFELVEKIKKQMNEMPYVSPNGYVYKYGDFFPNNHSLFAYNETVANDFYPKSKEEALSNGFVWREEEENEYTFSNYEIPDSIKDVKDDILVKILKCERTGKAYKIVQHELEFYRQMNIPIPRISPMERIRTRIGQLLPFKLYDRKCQCEGRGKNMYENTGKHSHGDAPCGKEIHTPYSQERKELVYCEECYREEMI